MRPLNPKVFRKYTDVSNMRAPSAVQTARGRPLEGEITQGGNSLEWMGYASGFSRYEARYWSLMEINS